MILSRATKKLMQATALVASLCSWSGDGAYFPGGGNVPSSGGNVGTPVLAGTNVGASGATFTINVNIPAGATIIIYQYAQSTQSNPTTPSDGTNTYTIFQSTTLGASGSNGIQCGWVKLNAAAVNGNITFTNNGSGKFLGAVVYVTWGTQPTTVSAAGNHGTSSSPDSGTTYGSVIGGGYITGTPTVFVGFMSNISIATITGLPGAFTNTTINSGAQPAGAVGFEFVASSGGTGADYNGANGGSQAWASGCVAIQ